MIKYPEKVPQEIAKSLNKLEVEIMADIIRRIEKAGMATASTDWQITRLQELGQSEEFIRKAVQKCLGLTDKQIENVFSDEAFKEYTGYSRMYRKIGSEQLPYELNKNLQMTVEAVTTQTKDQLRNITQSMGFVKRGADRLRSVPLSDYYTETLDRAFYDIQSGAFDYNTVLKRSINEMTGSGIRWIDYASSTHNRIDVAARRAILTGFRQIQSQISEQTARELGTETFEVSMHGGARPEHQEWQGKVYTKDELVSICGLGEVTGLCGINCYHTYWPFIPGVDVRTYTDEQIEVFNAKENEEKAYNGKTYKKYEALQQQRSLETQIRAVKERIYLAQQGGADEQTITEYGAKYQTLMQRYKAFSSSMGLPVQRARLTQGSPIVKQNIIVDLVNNVVANGNKPSIMKIDLQMFAEKDLINQDSTTLKRSIRKFEKRIEEHERKISDPYSFYPDFDIEYDTEEKRARCKKHWEKEIRNFRESIENRIAELKKRGDYDE